MTTLKLSTEWDARCMENMDIRMEEEDMATLTTAMTWSLQVMVMLTRALVAIIIIMTTWTVGWDSVRLSGLFFCHMNDRAILFSTKIISIIVFMFETFQLLQDFLYFLLFISFLTQFELHLCMLWAISFSRAASFSLHSWYTSSQNGKYSIQYARLFFQF